MHILPAG